MIPASHAMRRMVSTGSGVPAWVSAVRLVPSGPVACPSMRASRSISTPTAPDSTRETRWPQIEGVEGGRGELGLLAGGDVLGSGRDPSGDLGFQGLGDRFTADGVPFAGEVGHTGGGIDEGPGPRVATLFLQLADPVVTHQPVHHPAAPLLERRHRQPLTDRVGDELVGLGFELLALAPGEPVGLPGQHVGVTDPDGPVLQRSQCFGHLLHRVGPPGGLGRFPVPQTRLGPRSSSGHWVGLAAAGSRIGS